MTTQTHTPGPLSATREMLGEHVIRNREGFVLGRAYKASDARLWASAPELLEVAERIHELNQSTDILGGLGDWLSDVIQKATGDAVARCKRCQRTDRGKLLGGICGNCGDDLRMDAIAYEGPLR